RVSAPHSDDTRFFSGLLDDARVSAAALSSSEILALYNAAPSNTVPGAPTAASAVAGNASAQVSWTAPGSDGGSAITDYAITPYIGATAQTPILVGSAATSRNVTGLTNSTAYTFTVAAINAIGTGPASAALNAVTPTAPSNTAPAAPTLN